MRVWVRFYLLFKCVGPQLISLWSLHCVSRLRRDIILCLLMTEEHKTQSVQSFAWIKTEHELESRPPSLPRRSLILLMRPRVCSPMIDKIIGLSRNRQDLWDRHDIRNVLASSWVCWEWTSWGSSKRHTRRWSWAYAVATSSSLPLCWPEEEVSSTPKTYMLRNV